MGTIQPFPGLRDFQSIFAPSNKFYRKKSLGAPGMKVLNDSSVDMLPRKTSCMLYQGQGCFLWGIIDIWGFISYCRDGPRVFNFHFAFGTSPSRSGETDFLVSTLIQPFSFPSLRFEGSVSVVELPTRELVERVVCFRSFLLLGKRNDLLLMIGGRAN